MSEAELQAVVEQFTEDGPTDTTKLVEIQVGRLNQLLAIEKERDALREALREVGKWLSIQDSPPIGTNTVLVEIEQALRHQQALVCPELVRGER